MLQILCKIMYLIIASPTFPGYCRSLAFLQCKVALNSTLSFNQYQSQRRALTTLLESILC